MQKHLEQQQKQNDHLCLRVLIFYPCFVQTTQCAMDPCISSHSNKVNRV